MKKIIQLIIIMACSMGLQAQENCTEKLYKANILYEKGQITDAIDIAKSCAESSTNPTEQWQAYHLLAMAYLVNNQTSEARQAAEKMMELNPTYIPTSKDPSGLRTLLKKVEVIPKFSFGMATTIGGNVTYPHITGTYNGANYNKTYKSIGSWQFGLFMGYSKNKMLSFHTGLIASSKKFSLDYSLEGKNIKVNENLTYLDIPLFARFTALSEKKYHVFADVGLYGGRLLGSQSDFSLFNETANTTTSSNNVNSEKRRSNWEYGVITGLGIQYQLKKISISLDVKYYVSSFISRNSVNNAVNRYTNSDLFYNYYFIDDDIKLNNLAVSLSVVNFLNYKVIKEKD